MIKNEQIKSLCTRLRLYALPKLIESEVHLAQENGNTHIEFLHDLLSREVQERDSRDLQRRMKAAALPTRHDLDLFDHNYSQGITATELRELRRLGWLEQNYNIILMGPSGTGKTFIAAGFFNLINTLHEKSSLIITTNKAPTEWAKTLDDEVLASAILDRLLYHCEVIKLSGQSYRMGNRKSIFDNENLLNIAE